MHRASCGFMPPRGITETLSDVESVRVVHFYYMQVPEDFEPVCMSMTEDDHEEFLRWIDLDDPIKFYPEFFRQELLHPIDGVKHLVTDNRRGK